MSDSIPLVVSWRLVPTISITTHTTTMSLVVLVVLALVVVLDDALLLFTLDLIDVALEQLCSALHAVAAREEGDAVHLFVVRQPLAVPVVVAVVEAVLAVDAFTITSRPCALINVHWRRGRTDAHARVLPRRCPDHRCSCLELAHPLHGVVEGDVALDDLLADWQLVGRRHHLDVGVLERCGREHLLLRVDLASQPLELGVVVHGRLLEVPDERVELTLC
mmetsp:Transcript_41957/g.118995  ORF Transcript_41957/g.118995 Transcript_41957/m.118995 type:complete len:220 (+) Transcript_41957:1132-1791(+)